MKDLGWTRYSTKLLPCPFCGEEPWGIFGEPGEITVECETEGCGGVWQINAATKEEAAKRWNRRASASPSGVPCHKETKS